MENLFDIPNEVIENEADEFFEALICGKNGVNVERIVSMGQVTEENRWYDQDQDEWVAVIKGSAKVQHEDGREICLEVGDHLLIPKHVRHRVSYTSSPCIWLAVFGDDLILKCAVPKSLSSEGTNL